jgi:hypothetical protein
MLFYNISYEGDRVRRIMVQGQPLAERERPYLKNKTKRPGVGACGWGT